MSWVGQSTTQHIAPKTLVWNKCVTWSKVTEFAHHMVLTLCFVGIAICSQNKIETGYLVRCRNKIDDSPIFLKLPQCTPASWWCSWARWWGPTWATWWSGWCSSTRCGGRPRPTWWSRSEKEVSPSNWWHSLSQMDKVTLKQFDCEIWDSQVVLWMEYF